jgi:Zn-dependent peptidase ImmA (M78 family)
MLFTLAHELGHVIAHHNERRAIVFDLSSQIGGTKRHRSKAEAFVNAFASALLMPARGVGRALKQIRQSIRAQSDAVGDIELLYLARFYGVGFETAALRCEKLGLLPSGSAWALSDHLKKNHRGAERRADALGLPRREPIAFPRVSRNLLRVAAKKIELGQLSLGWVTDKLSCSVNEVYAARAPREVHDGPYH